MILSGANDKIQVVTDASADIEISRSWSHNNAGTITFDGGPMASITSATTTDVVTAAGASQQRSIREIQIFNNHGSTPCTVTVQRTDGTNTVDLKQVVLAAGESLSYSRNGVWSYYDSTGKLYVGTGPFATQAEMEAGTSLTTMVAPGTQHFHPGHPKCWVEGTANSTAILASYNITSLADTATGAQTVTIATDFSSANWACQVTRSEDDLTLVYSATYDAKTAGTVIMRSAVEAGSGSDPTSASGNASWSMVGHGDLA